LRSLMPKTQTLHFNYNAIVDLIAFKWTYINNNIKNLFLA
jgi:hypothetical protein